MKTSKELSQEVMDKISKYEEIKLRFRKRVRHIFAAVIMVGFLLPTAVYYVTSEALNHDLPISDPFMQDENMPFDPDETPVDSTETWEDGLEITVEV